MLAGMLIVILSGRHCRSPGTLPYIFLRRTQLTATPQRPSTRCDLNGQQRPPWCPTPVINAHNGHPACWLIVVCRMRQCREWGTMAAVGRRRPPRSARHALASFYLVKAHITTHNNQSISPNQRCEDDDSSVGLGDHCAAIEI